MIQRIVAKEYGEYTVKQYEYTFEPGDADHHAQASPLHRL